MNKLSVEKELWFDENRAIRDFSAISKLYDYIMGNFEVRSNRKAIKLLNFFEQCSVLDMGVGTGLSLKEILKNLPSSAQLVGLDYCDKMLAESQKRINKHKKFNNVGLVLGEATNTNFTGEKFDFIFSSFLLDLLSTNKRNVVLQEMKRILKPNGIICISVMEGEGANYFDTFLINLYNLGYGNWNKIWQFFFNGYAPHCRPIKLKETLHGENFTIIKKTKSYVFIFPVSIYLIKPSHYINKN